MRNEEIGNQLLKNLERLRMSMLKEYAYHYDEQIPVSVMELLENKNRKPSMDNEYPVFQFCYQGSLPLFDRLDQEYTSVIRDYYRATTFNQYDFEGNTFEFEKAYMIIQHFQKEHIISDLDNRCRKFIVDAIRHTGLIKDDNWQSLSFVEEGCHTDGEPFVNVFLLDEKNLLDFMPKRQNYLLDVEQKFSGITFHRIEKEHQRLQEIHIENQKKYESIYD